MLNYTETVVETKPRLVIEYDSDSESPRKWTNLGYFITCDRNYHSPDDNEQLKSIIEETGNKAMDQEEHIKMIKERYEEENNEKVLAIYPITKYEHGGVAYHLGSASGFDNSNNGFYIITDKTQKEFGTEKSDWEEVIKGELKTFNQWCSGTIYRFILYNEDGEMEDSCCSFYDIEDIRECLPEEFDKENLEEYLIN